MAGLPMLGSPVSDLFARLNGTVPSVSHSLLTPLRAIAFWTAIALPFLYVPLLASGLESGSLRMAFALLVVANVITLIVGHPYARD